MISGIVKEYDRRKDFGFISCIDGQDYFVHVSELRENSKSKGLKVG